jgi:hypothetical protein
MLAAGLPAERCSSAPNRRQPALNLPSGGRNRAGGLQLPVDVSAQNDIKRSLHGPLKEQPVPHLLWLIIVVVVVLALLGYFGRGRLGR